jgi:mercuric ion transport protein
MSSEATSNQRQIAPLASPARLGTSGAAFFAGMGLLAAVAASACCVLPLALGAAGIGGAWLSTLILFAPYRMALRIVAIVLLGAGFWLVYARRPIGVAGSTCLAVPRRSATKALLWIGLAVLIVVLSADWWVPLVT